MAIEGLVSIITVSYNSEKTISDTIKSVLNQNYTKIEYIIIDGCSSDNTISIVQSFNGLFINKGFKYICISEPDHGIYDAMNKGIALAKGEIVHILNSDDRYYNNCVISDIVKLFDNGSSLISSSVVLDLGNKVKLLKTRKLFRILTIPHPGVFVKNYVYDKLKFDLSYTYASDVDFIIRACRKYQTTYIDNITVVMMAGGLGGSKQCVIESNRIHCKYGNYLFMIFSNSKNYTKIAIKFIFRIWRIIRK